MAEVKGHIIKGHKQNSLLLWTPEEKHLFVKKGSPNKKGEVDYICYQTVLIESDESQMKCTARVKKKGNKYFKKSLPHTKHANHEDIYRDLLSRNEIIDDSIAFSNLCNGLSMKVPVSDFFTRALSKRELGKSKLRLKSMKRNIGRLTTKKRRPKNVKTPAAIADEFKNSETFTDFGLNLRETEHFYIDTIVETEFSFTIFASHQIINLTKEHIPPGQRRYMMDGTFDVTPLGSYYQLLIIYIEYKNDVGFNLNVSIILFSTSCIFKLYRDIFSSSGKIIRYFRCFMF